METPAVRNKNPGNLKDPATGEFRTFTDPAEGKAALYNDLTLKMTGASKTGITGDSSLLEFAKIYAPASDDNDPVQYAANLANKLGVSPDERIGNLQNRIDDFASAISSNEDPSAVYKATSPTRGFEPKPFSQQAQEPAGEPPIERGFAGELVPTAFAVGGGILGGIAGAPAAGVGAIPGGIAGAAAGGALGETIQQGIEKRFGQREDISPGQIATTGAISGAGQAVGGVVSKGLGLAVSKAKQPVINLCKFLSGHNDEVINKALTRTPGVLKGVEGGETELTNMVRRSVVKLSQLSKDYVTQSKEAIKNILKEPLSEDTLFAKALASPAKKFDRARTEIFNKIGDFTKGIANSLRQNHNIGVSKSGNLSFARPNQPSRIVGVSEQKAVQDAFGLVKSVRDNLSLKHVDSVLERLIVLKSKTPAGTPTGPETKAVIGGMMDDLNSFIKNVYPKSYVDVLENNLQRRVFITESKELLGDSAYPSPKEISVITGRVLQLFNTGKLAVREGVEKLGAEVGEDVVGASAGTLLKTGGQLSVRATQLTKRGLLEKTLEFIPRKALDNFVKTGNLTGELTESKFIQNTAKTLGITTKALMLEIANLSAEKQTR